MPVFAVQYTYDDRDADRAVHRPAHREHLRALLASGDLLASGPLDAGTGALLLLVADSPDAALALLDDDPFRVHGLVAEHAVHAWAPVIGPWEHLAG